MLYYLTQILVLALQLCLHPTLGLLPLLLEPQDCVRGLVLVVEVTEEVAEVVVVAGQVAVVAAAAAAILGVKEGGSCISQREQSSSIHRESWT